MLLHRIQRCGLTRAQMLDLIDTGIAATPVYRTGIFLEPPVHDVVVGVIIDMHVYVDSDAFARVHAARDRGSDISRV